MTAVFAVLCAMLGGLVLVHLGLAYQDETLFEYADHLVGRILGGVFLFAIGVYFLELSALATREFGEVVVTSVLQRTPIPVTVLVIVLLVVVASRNDVAKFTRILTFYMPIVYFPALVIVALSLKNAKVANLMPLLATFHDVPFQNTVLSTGIVTALFQNFMIAGIVIPFMYQPQRAKKSVLVGIGLGGALYVLLIYSALSVFGTEEMKNLLWPTLELAKTAAMPTFFLERLDPIFLAVWVTAVFCAIYAAYYLSIQAFSHVLRFQDHRALCFMGMPLVFTLARLPSNIVDLYTVTKMWGLIGLTLTFGYPLLLFLIHLVKSRHVAAKKRPRRVGTTS